jgi:hypothetical protein
LNDDDMAAFIQNMDWNYSAEQIQAAVEALSAEMYTAFTHAGLTSAGVFDQASVLRMSELRRAALLGYEPTKEAAQLQLAMAGNDMQNLGNPGANDERWAIWARFLAGRGDWDGGD